MQALSSYHFPGNIRELKHLVESVLAVSDPHRPIELSDLPESVQKGSTGLHPQKDKIHEETHPYSEDSLDPELFERRRIEKALRSSNGKIEAAASILGISRITLWRHMKRLNMKQNSFHF
jgi:transcriptional regulator with PAS, ATPase and Fis domain